MKHRLNLLLIISGLALLPISVTAEETSALESLHLSFHKQEQALLEGYDTALGSLMAEAKKKGDLDLYLVVETEKKRFEEEKYVPSLSDANVAFKSAAGNYCKARTGVLRQYVLALDDLVKTEVQADRIESAKEIKAEKEKIAFELADLESKLPKMEKRETTKTTTALPASLKGCVLYYSFDKDDGKNVADKSGKKNVGEVKGAKWTPKGKLQGASEFDGTGYIDAGDMPVRGIKTAITMSAWVFPRLSNGDYPVVAKEGGGGRETFWFGVYFNRFGLLLGNGRGWGLNARASGDVAPDEWQHLAVTWDGSVWRCYHNGKVVGEGNYSGKLPDSPSPVQIGQNSEYRNTHFQGTIDEVMLFDRALTGKEIKQIYDAQK